MKILIVLTSDISVTTFYLGYLTYLKSRDIEVMVASRFASPESQFAAQSTGAQVFNIDFLREPSLFQDLRAATNLFRLIRREKPDAVIYATPKASLVAALTSRLARVPLRIYQLWGLRFETARGITRLLLRTAERIIFLLSNEVIAVSASVANVASESKLGRPCSLIGSGSSHGVDLNKFAPELNEVEIPAEFLALKRSRPDSYFVTLVARLSRDKGVDVFIEAIETLASASEPVIGVLVGDVEDSHINKKLKAAIDHQTILHVPFVKDIRPYVKYALLNCLPSLREGLPNVVLEAAAMGTPSIVSDSTGCIDSVINGVTGIIVPKSDPATLATSIKQVADEPIFRRYLSSNGINFVREHYDSTQVFKNNSDFLISKLSSHRR